MYVTAIVLAAGKGLRLRSHIPKPLAKINSQPLIIYCLKALNSHPWIKDILVVANAGNRAAIVKEISRYKITRVRDVVIGGALRQDSVREGLKALDERADLVLIHDGVRPFIDRRIITSVIAGSKYSGAAIAGVPVKATIKKIKNEKIPATKSGGSAKNFGGKNKTAVVIEKTLERKNLWEIQTPQVFRKALLLEAYRKFSSRVEVTDDAMLVERLGVKVRVVRGSYNNIKITTPEDLVLAEGILKCHTK